MGVSHLSLDLRLGCEGGHRVYHHHIDGAGAHQHVGDFEGLFAGVRLGDQQLINIDPQLSGIVGIEGVLGINKSRRTALFLGFGQHMKSQCGFA